MRLWKREVSRSAARSVVAEATAVVEGELADRYAPYERIPAWTPVNALAHSDRRRLIELTHSRAAGHPGSWCAAVGGLAELMLDSIGDDDAQLRRLQREALVPLELGLLDRSVPAPRTPSRLAALVSDTIEDYRIHRHG